MNDRLNDRGVVARPARHPEYPRYPILNEWRARDDYTDRYPSVTLNPRLTANSIIRHPVAVLLAAPLRSSPIK